MQRQPFARDIWRSLDDGSGNVHPPRPCRRGGTLAAHPRSRLWASANRAGRTTRFSPASKDFSDSTFPFSLALRANPSCKPIVAGEGLDLRSAQRVAGLVTGPWPEVGPALADSDHQARGVDPSLLAVGDAAAVVAAILGGAHIVRVHDPAASFPPCASPTHCSPHTDSAIPPFAAIAARVSLRHVLASTIRVRSRAHRGDTAGVDIAGNARRAALGDAG